MSSFRWKKFAHFTFKWKYPLSFENWLISHLESHRGFSFFIVYKSVYFTRHTMLNVAFSTKHSSNYSICLGIICMHDAMNIHKYSL